jgi:hypothetical protein
LGIDYNYFFYTSPSQVVRDQFDVQLFEVYYSSFSETLRRCNFSKVPTKTEVKNEIRKYEFYGEIVRGDPHITSWLRKNIEVLYLVL